MNLEKFNGTKIRYILPCERTFRVIWFLFNHTERIDSFPCTSHIKRYSAFHYYLIISIHEYFNLFCYSLESCIFLEVFSDKSHTKTIGLTIIQYTHSFCQKGLHHVRVSPKLDI